MATLICSFFLLGCLAFFFFGFVQYTCTVWGLNFQGESCVCREYCMIESISGERFFHSALLDSLTISVWHIQMTVTHHHTLPLIHFTFPLPRVFTCTRSHWTNEHSELWKLRKIRIFHYWIAIVYIIKNIYTCSVLHFHCSNSRLYLPFLHFADQCRCRVVISVLGVLSLSAVWGISGAAG